MDKLFESTERVPSGIWKMGVQMRSYRLTDERTDWFAKYRNANSDNHFLASCNNNKNMANKLHIYTVDMYRLAA